MSNILMKKRMKYISIFFVLIYSTVGGWAQNRSQYINAADKAFLEKNYYAALSYYLEALEFDSTDIHVNYDAAESARLFSSYNIAKRKYQYVVDHDNENTYPLASFRLAEVCQMLGDYSNANRLYEMYLSEHEGEDSYFTAKANKEVAATDWALTLLSKPAENITVNNLGDVVNSEFSEFGGTLEPNGITFSSLSFDTKESQDIPAKPISKVVKSVDGAPPVEYYAGFNRDNEHTAHTAYNINRSKVYYTVCQYVNTTDIRCDLYSRAILGDGTLGEEFKLPEPINNPEYTTTQPNVGFDQTSGKEVLYFVSDRPGGEGKLDIWYVTIEGVNKFSDPMNLSELNTAEDEMTPFFHNDAQVMYFSSTGYTSLGGLDIYRSVKENSTFGQVENLGVPVNSSFNDVYYTIASDGSRALFSSNRIGAKYIDVINESCCYDIFEAIISDITIRLNAVTFDGLTLDSLKGATVKLIDAKTGELIEELTNENGGDHVFTLEKGREYLVVSTKDGYLADTFNINTNRIYRPEDITRKIFLKRKTLELQLYTFDDVSKLPLPGTTVRLTDLTDNTIQEVRITNEMGHDFGFDLKPGHLYRVEASKDRYVSVADEFVAEDTDGTGIIIKRLFLARKDLNIYLPLALYFDNDQPDEKTVKLTTNRTYDVTFDSYVVKKQEFKEEYTKGMTTAEAILAEQRMDDFFEIDVKGGFDKFQAFLAAMLRQLDQGKTFELSLRGFASPRADSRYNLALSQRRVVSVQNELVQYANGAFKPYIERGQLKITQLSYGENLSPDNVSDVFYDRRNSVFSPEASKERRVEIVEIKSQQSND